MLFLLVIASNISSLRSLVTEYATMRHGGDNTIVLGEVDSLLVEGPDGPRVYTLAGAEEPYRLLVERMCEAAVVPKNPRLRPEKFPAPSLAANLMSSLSI